MDRQPVDHYVLLRKYSLRKMKGRVGCGHAAINGRLQENLADFLARHAIVQHSAQVHAKFVSAIQPTIIAKVIMQRVCRGRPGRLQTSPRV